MNTITLDYPITHDGQKITSINLRRMTVGDNLASQKTKGTDAEQEIFLMANLAELAPEAIHKLDMKDYAKLQKVLQGFLS